MAGLLKYFLISIVIFTAGCGFAIIDQENNRVKTFGMEEEDLSYITDQAPQE